MPWTWRGRASRGAGRSFGPPRASSNRLPPQARAERGGTRSARARAGAGAGGARARGRGRGRAVRTRARAGGSQGVWGSAEPARRRGGLTPQPLCVRFPSRFGAAGKMASEMESSLEASFSNSCVVSGASGCLPPARSRIFKIIVIGDSNVGKTCLTYRFCAGRFPDRTEATIGVDFRERAVEIDGERIKVSEGRCRAGEGPSPARRACAAGSPRRGGGWKRSCVANF